MRRRRSRSVRGGALLAAVALFGLGCGGGSHQSTAQRSGQGGVGALSAGGRAGVGAASGASGAGAGAGAGAAGAGGFGAAGQGGALSGQGGALSGQGGALSGQGGISAGGAAAGIGGRAPATPRPVPSGLTIEPNPNSVLSCIVSWTTDVGATSEVVFSAGSDEFRIVHYDYVTAHRVLVIGMHADTEYVIKAVSANPGGSTSLAGRFTTGALPASIPVGSVKIADPAAWDAGWTLVNVMPPAKGGGSGVGTEPGFIVMYDETGAPVWYFQNGMTADERGDVSLHPLGNSDLMLGPSSGEPPKEVDLEGNVVWQGPAQPPLEMGLPASDDPQAAPMVRYGSKLYNGDYVFLRGNTSNGVTGAYVEELSTEKALTWSWDLFAQLEPPTGAAADWCHPNVLSMDFSADYFYLSCRFLGIIKAKRAGDQAIGWTLGGAAGGSFTFTPPEAAFADQHDFDIRTDGTALVYANGSAPGVPEGKRSRLLRFSLDEAAHTAKLDWEFPGSFTVDPWYTDHWYTPDGGDVDWLSNGNVLAAAGFRAAEQTRVFEVRPTDGAVVFELTLPVGYASYQAERLSPPPLVQKP